MIDERWDAGDRSFGVRYAKERLARHDRDLATLEQVVHPDASEGTRCGQLAKILFQIDMADDGLAYALRAIAAGGFMTHGETPYDLAAAEQLRRGDHEGALRLLKTVRQLQEIQTVCPRAGLDDHFAEVIIALREEFARRPTFIAAMDRAGFR